MYMSKHEKVWMDDMSNHEEGGIGVLYMTHE